MNFKKLVIMLLAPLLLALPFGAADAAEPEPDTTPVINSQVDTGRAGNLLGSNSRAFTSSALAQVTEAPPEAVTITPARLLETRSGSADFATVDGLFEGQGVIGADQVLELQIAGRGPIPLSSVDAVIINVSAVTPTGGFGWITAFPCGTQPNAASLTYNSGDISVSNEVIAKLSATGSVCLYSRQSTHVTVDATGYVPSTSNYVSLDPARLLETRSGGGTFTTTDGQFLGGGAIAAGNTLELQVGGRGGIPATDVTAVAINISAITPTGGFGWITAFPCGAQPNASSLTYEDGDISVSNEVIAKLSATGTVCLYSSQTTHVAVDASGYFPSTSTYESLDPTRILETRSGSPDFTTADGQFQGQGEVTGGTTLELTVAGRSGIPADDVDAVVVNVSAVTPTGGFGWITSHPCGSRPNAAALTYNVGDVSVSNEVVAKVSAAGTICLYSSQTAHLIVDATGYFVATPDFTGMANDLVRTQSVGQIVAALEAHAADYRTFKVANAGQWGQGTGGYSIGGIELYPVSIEDRLIELGYLQPGEVALEPTEDRSLARDYAIEVCKDRAVVYSLAYQIEPTAEDLTWWLDNGCVRGNRDQLDKTYFKLSRPIGELLAPQIVPTVAVQGFSRDVDGRLVATIVVNPNGGSISGVKVLATAPGGQELRRCEAMGCSTDAATGHITSLTFTDGGWTSPTEIGTFTFDNVAADTVPLDLELVEAIDGLGVDINLGGAGGAGGAPAVPSSDDSTELSVNAGPFIPAPGAGTGAMDTIFGYPIADGYVIAPRSHRWYVTGINDRLVLAFISSSFSLDASGNELKRNGPYVHFGSEHASGPLHPNAAWSCTETTMFLVFFIFPLLPVETSACVQVIPCTQFTSGEILQGILDEPGGLTARANDCRAAILDDDGGTNLGDIWNAFKDLITGDGPSDAIKEALAACKDAFVDGAEQGLALLALLDPRNWDDILNDGAEIAVILIRAAQEDRLIAALEEIAITVGVDLLALDRLQDGQGNWQLQGNMVDWVSYLSCRTLIDFLTGAAVVKLKQLANAGRRWLARNDAGIDDGGSDLDLDGTSCPAGSLLPVNSFPPGTMVRMADDSHKAIDHIGPGDWVISHNVDTSVWEPKQVVAQWSHLERGPPVTLTLTDGGSVTGTADHRFYTSNRGWVALVELAPGDQLLGNDGAVIVSTVSSGELGDWRVYDLAVADNHNFTVQAGVHDLLVHNAGCAYRQNGENASIVAAPGTAEFRVAVLRLELQGAGIRYQYHHMVSQKFFRNPQTADQANVAQILIDAGLGKDSLDNLIPMPYSPSELASAGLNWAPNHVHRGGTRAYDDAIVQRFKNEFPSLSIDPNDPADVQAVVDVLEEIFDDIADPNNPTLGPHMQPGGVVIKTDWTPGA